jgi:ketosteroid isomerase-like protein
VSDTDRTRIVRASYTAYETGDRSALEPLIADDFTFSSPADVGIDRDRYFERCWPNSENLRSFDVVRLREIGGDEVLVTYEAQRTDGSRFRNTEILRVDGDRIRSAEVYFGWNL